jgi:ADP-heptose:LPS heptosyltransferase
MHAFGNIVVFHPAAIGDAMLATPIATALKMNFPAAKLTYWTHPDLRPILLGLCPAIDEVVDYVRDANIFQQYKTFESFKADLFVDLANSPKSRAMTWMSRMTILRYEKQAANATPIRHAAINFLDTIRPVCNEFPNPIFPTLFPDVLVDRTLDPLLAHEDIQHTPLIGIVPGVGKHRPHRAWIEAGYQYLLENILSGETHLPVLIGGPDEEELCQRLHDSVSSTKRFLNLAGKLTLPQTAAVLKRCAIVVSGDTGPAHIAVAVGTRVIGLYGPTFPERSGPFGNSDLCLDQSNSCRCHNFKCCQFTPAKLPGECMNRIMLVEVIERLNSTLSLCEPPPAVLD